MERTIQFRSLLAASLAFSAAALAASAQSPSEQAPPPPPVASQAQSLEQRLALTHEQRVQYRGIVRDRRAQVKAVESDTTLSPHDRHEKIREIRRASDTQIRGILNQNQQEEYDAIKREHAANAAARRAADPAPPQPQPQ